jgi:four helix bundle protein
MKEQKFRKLKVWDKAMDFVENVYKTTSIFPTLEQYGLTSQLRRAALSISLNIAEGSGAGSDKEFCRFLNFSLRSAYEVICGLEVSKRLNYCSESAAEKLMLQCEEISAMLTGLRKSLS